MADVIYEALTGEKGYFDTRVVFVDEQDLRPSASSASPSWTRTAQCANADQGNDLVLDPALLPSRQEITYMSFDGDNPSVYLLQIETGQRESSEPFRA